jgi:predicted acetyltransferase
VHDSYRFDILPLDTPDDDPRWREYLEVFQLTLLSAPSTDAQVAAFRDNRRADGARLAMVTASTPSGDAIAGGFSAFSGHYNAGAEDAATLVINTIGVNPAHRRRGVLRELMTRELASAKAAGIPFATLSASEATIYGRFGFAPVAHGAEAKIDVAKFRLRDEAPVAAGRVEWIAPSFLEPHYWRVVRAFHAANVGSVLPYHRTFLGDTGQWDSEAEGPSKKLRAIAHFDESGTVDGFALFEHRGWDHPRKVHVQKVVGANFGVELALWQALASMDLIERLDYYVTASDPLLPALVDERAVRIDDVGDLHWLRILDVPRAVAARSFDTDGEVTVRITDSLGHADGTWHIAARDGRGSAEATDAAPQVTLDVAELARVWESDTTATALAQAGRVTGEPRDVAAFDRLFHRFAPMRNTTGY